MTDLARRQTDIVVPTHGPGQQLGLRRKAQLRLGLGYQQEGQRFPVKTEYFIPHGNTSAVRRFVEQYGDKPRAIDIQLPASLGSFLEIKHIAFAGGNREKGGVLKAIGRTNFALEGTLGGPDVLTVFNVGRDDDGKPELQPTDIEIDGVDDPQAQALGVYLQMTVTFGIPDVLGFGGVAETHSKGKESIDTLWSAAVDIYSHLGGLASMVLEPKLVLKESKMLTPGGIYAPVYVLDLYVPQSRRQVLDGIREYRELTGPSAGAALYGPRALAPGSADPLGPDAAEVQHQAAVSTDGPGADGTGEGAAAGNGPEPAAASEPEPEPLAPTEPEPEPEPEPTGEVIEDAVVVDDTEVAARAAAFVIPSGQYAKGGTKAKTLGHPDGMTLGQVLELGDEGRTWLRWALRNVNKTSPGGQPFMDAVWTFAHFHAPDLYQQIRAEKEAAQ